MLSKRLKIFGPLILRDLFSPFFPQWEVVCAISDPLGFLLCPISPDTVWSAFFCRDSVVLRSDGIKPPLKPFFSGLRLISRWLNYDY